MSEIKNKTSGPVGVNWAAVDFSRKTADIMAELGVSKQAVSAARVKNKVPPPEKQGGWRGPPRPAVERLELSAKAAEHLLALARAAKVKPSAYVLSLKGPC